MMRKRHAVCSTAPDSQKGSGTTTPTTGKSCPRAMCLSPSFGPDVAGLVPNSRCRGPNRGLWTDRLRMACDPGGECGVVGVTGRVASLFGDFQDGQEDSWTVYHSRLSFAMNVKCFRRAKSSRGGTQVAEAPSHASIEQVEGFIRRPVASTCGASLNYMRLRGEEFLRHTVRCRGGFGRERPACAACSTPHPNFGPRLRPPHPTPHGDRNSPCWPASTPTKSTVVFGGVHRRHRGEITNTRGMSQFADGGIVGTKPYVSSANYMHKMGPTARRGPVQPPGQDRGRCLPLQQPTGTSTHGTDTCWENPRIGMVYRTWDKMDPAKQQALLDRGDAVLHNLEQL